MYELIIPNNVKRDIKKLDKPIINNVILLFEDISENPFNGFTLSGDLSHLRKIEFHMQGVSYRIVYEIIEDQLQVKIIHIGSRENFYNELRRRM